MGDIFTISLVFSTIRLATPLVWAAIGGLYSERSGVVNIALEGLMLAGAFTAAAVTFYAHSPWVGLAAASIAGAAVAFVLAVVCIRFEANEVVAGTGINILFRDRLRRSQGTNCCRRCRRSFQPRRSGAS
jgi:simple sugar transport system permease protein